MAKWCITGRPANLMSDMSQPASAAAAAKPTGNFTIICNELDDVRITSEGEWNGVKVKTHVKVGPEIYKGGTYTVTVTNGVVTAIIGPTENKVKQRKDEDAEARRTALEELQAAGVQFEAGDSATTHVTGTRGAIAAEVETICASASVAKVRGVADSRIFINCAVPARVRAGHEGGHWSIGIDLREIGGTMIASIFHYGPSI